MSGNKKLLDFPKNGVFVVANNIGVCRLEMLLLGDGNT